MAIKKEYKFKTWLPLFPGFYDTLLEPDEDMEIESINQERISQGLEEVNIDEINFDYDTYRKEVSIKCCEVVEQWLLEERVIKSIKFEEIISPKEYNFYNDSIDIEVTIYPNLLLKKVKENYDNFTKYIKERYSSRDGFISFHSNCADIWLKETKNFKEFTDTHKLGAILEFCTQSDVYTLCEEVLDNGIYLSAINFNELTNG